MNLDFLSKSYAVRRLGDDDIAILFDLMKKNMVFYRFHPPFVTRESILEDMNALPPQKVRRTNITPDSLKIKR